MATLAATAIALAKLGRPVFPCWPRRKEPITKRGVLDATTDIEVVTAWWSDGPDLNIGMATGTVSGVFVLDVDGQEGKSSLSALEKLGPLPPSVTSNTGKGKHILFRMPAMPIGNSAGRLGTGLDVRGDGGYVIVPPSVHPSGAVYQWGNVRELAEIAAMAARADTGPEAPEWPWNRKLARGVDHANTGRPAQ